MSFTDVRSYFRTRMKALGHKEWKDALNFENIPESIQDRTFHIESGTSNVNSQNQQALDVSQDVVVRLFVKGYRDTSGGIDRAISLAQLAICDIVDPDNANGDAIKNVDLVTMDVVERSDSNDNTIVVEMNYSVRLIMNI